MIWSTATVDELLKKSKETKCCACDILLADVPADEKWMMAQWHSLHCPGCTRKFWNPDTPASWFQGWKSIDVN